MFREAALAALCLALVPLASAGEFRVGWAQVDVTPSQPVALGGQMNTRISRSVHDPLTATAPGHRIGPRTASRPITQ